MNTQQTTEQTLSTLRKLINLYPVKRQTDKETIYHSFDDNYIYCAYNRPLAVITADKILFANADSPYLDPTRYRNVAKKVNLLASFVVRASKALTRDVETVDQSVICSYTPVNQR